jgi:hypothetical protein
VIAEAKRRIEAMEERQRKRACHRSGDGGNPPRQSPSPAFVCIPGKEERHECRDPRR